MRKNIPHLSIGDWVVLETQDQFRPFGRPRKVTAISKTRVYLEWLCPELTLGDKRDMSDSRFASITAILHVFSDETTAHAAYEFALANAEEYRRRARDLHAEFSQRFSQFMDNIPAAPEPVAGAGVGLVPEATASAPPSETPSPVGRRINLLDGPPKKPLNSQKPKATSPRVEILTANRG